MVLVIGVGNEFRGDDAAGLLAARRLVEMDLSMVTVIEQRGEGADLIAAWEGAECVYLIDAAHSGAKVGTIHRFDAHSENPPGDYLSFSSHAFGVLEAVELSRSLGQLPSKVVMYGIEGGRFETGSEVSPAVETAVDQVVAALVSELG